VHKSVKYSSDVIELTIIDTWIHADEKGIIHDYVGVFQVTHYSMSKGLESRVAKQVSAEEIPCFDPV